MISGLYGACKGGHEELVDYFLGILQRKQIYIKGIDNLAIQRILNRDSRNCHIVSRILVDIPILNSSILRHALDIVYKHKHIKLIDKLVAQNNGDYGNIATIAKMGYLDIIKKIKSLQPKPYDFLLHGALSAAYEGGHIEMIEYLLQQGAVPPPKDVLSRALRGGHVDLVDQIINLNHESRIFLNPSGEFPEKYFDFDIRMMMIYYEMEEICEKGNIEAVNYAIKLFQKSP